MSKNRAKTTVYQDDLEFLNKFSSRKLFDMQSAFKNEGRGLAKKSRLDSEDKKPDVGLYRPNYDVVMKNPDAKVLQIFKKT